MLNFVFQVFFVVGIVLLYYIVLFPIVFVLFVGGQAWNAAGGLGPWEGRG